MYVISVLEFLRTGKFGPIKCGMSELELQQVLGEPTDEGGFSRKQKKPLVLVYGDLQCGLDRETRAVIYLQLYPHSRRWDDDLMSADSYQFDSTGISFGMPFEDLCAQLKSADIQYDLIREIDDNILVTKSGVKAYFRAQIPMIDAPDDELMFLCQIMCAT